MIEDITTALSHICRSAGHLPELCVAQHSALVSQQVLAKDAPEELLHDGAEAYVHNIPAPLKHIQLDCLRVKASADDIIRGI